MEIKIAFKAPGNVQADINIVCNAEELKLMIDDPIYQQLGTVLVDHVRHENERRNSNNQQKHDSDRFDCFRRVVETDRKCQRSHNEVVDAAIKQLQYQANKILDSVIKDIRNK
jgi:hypothetical protein